MVTRPTVLSMSGGYSNPETFEHRRARGASVTFAPGTYAAAPTVVMPIAPAPAPGGTAVRQAPARAPPGPRSHHAAASGWRGTIIPDGIGFNAWDANGRRAASPGPTREQRPRSAPRVAPMSRSNETGAARIAALAQPRAAMQSPRRVRALSELHPEESADGVKSRYGGALLQSAVNDYFHSTMRRETIVAWDKSKRVVKAPAVSDLDHVKFGHDPNRATIMQDATTGIGFGGVGAISHAHAHTSRGCTTARGGYVHRPTMVGQQ